MSLKNIILFSAVFFIGKTIFRKKKVDLKVYKKELSEAFKIVDKNPYLKEFILKPCEQQLYNRLKKYKENLQNSNKSFYIANSSLSGVTDKTKVEVELFLKELKKRLKDKRNFKIWFRNKNINQLFNIGISYDERIEIVKNLKISNFSYISIENKKAFVFGKTKNDKNIYIKIEEFTTKKDVIVQSFHIQEKILKFPYR